MLKNLIVSGLLASAPMMSTYQTDLPQFYEKASVPNLVSLGTYEYHFIQDYTYVWSPQDYADGDITVSVEYNCGVDVYYRGDSYVPSFAYDEFLFDFSYYDVYFSCSKLWVADGPSVSSCYVSYDDDNPYISGGRVNVANYINNQFSILGDDLLFNYETLVNFTTVNIVPAPYRSTIQTNKNLAQVSPFSNVRSSLDFTMNLLYDGYIGNFPCVYSPKDTIDLAGLKQSYDDLGDRIVSPLYPILQNYRNSIQQSQDQYELGYSSGYNYGYGIGYSSGWQEGFDADSTALTVFSGILNIAMVPVNFFLSMFNFELLGINLTNLVTAVISIGMIVILLRTFFGGGAGGK